MASILAAPVGMMQQASARRTSAQGNLQGRQGSALPSGVALVYPEISEGMAVIECHVPTLARSKEVGQLSHLSRSLVVYRLAFGQNRQDDLVNFLLEIVPETKLLDLLEEVQIDLSPS